MGSKSFRFFYPQKQVQIEANSAFHIIVEMKNLFKFSISNFLSGMIENIYEGASDDMRHQAEDESAELIQSFIDKGIMIPIFNKEECINALIDYTIWAVSKKDAEAKLDRNTLVNMLSIDRKYKKTLHSINMQDLSIVISQNSIPNNFVVWIEERPYGNICMAFSEFTENYIYLCIYK